MRTWIITATIPQELNSYGCYCEEDPYDLLFSDEKYEDLYLSLCDDLYGEYGYLRDEVLDEEDTEDWSDEDWDSWHDEQYNNFCEDLSFETTEVFDEGDIKDLEIIIDER